MKKKAGFLLAALVALPGAAQETTPPLRNTLTVSGEVARDDSRPVGGHNSRITSYVFDLEYARTMWPTFELTFAGGARGVRTTDALNTTTTQAFRSVQVGGRLYFFEPRRPGWTPYADASIGEGWLNRLGGRTSFYGYELAAGLAAHLAPRADLRVSANYDRYVAWDKVGSDRDTLTRIGLRLGFAYRF
jgi:hypothetical protein